MDVEQEAAAAAAAPPCAADPAAPPVTTTLGAPAAGFSSFNAAAFFQAQQQQQQADESRRKEHLARAAQAFLASSSSSDSEDGGDAAPRGRSAEGRQRSPSPSDRRRRRHRSSSSGSGSGSGGGGKRGGSKRARRDEEGRRRKDKRSSKEKRSGRERSGGGKAGGAKESDEREKIIRLEMKAAALRRQVGRGRSGGGGGGGAARGGSAWLSATPAAAPVGALFSSGQSQQQQQQQLFYYDRSGDVQNVVYRGLYAGDVASFHRRDPLKAAARPWRPFALQRQALHGGSGEPPGRAQRYWHPVVVASERSARVRRVHLQRGAAPGDASSTRQQGGASVFLGAAKALRPPGGPAPKPSPMRRPPLPAFLPLGGRPLHGAAAALPSGFGYAAAPHLHTGPGGAEDDEQEGETVEQWVLRQTKELNLVARGSPRDVDAWLELAAFQDEVARLLASSARRSQLDVAAVAAKKVAILERAFSQHNPHSVRLLLALMEAVRPLLDPPTLAARWESALRRWQADALARWQQFDARGGLSTALQQQPGGRAADERAFQALFSVAAGGGGSGDGEEEGGGDGPWGVVGAVLGEAVLWQRYVHVRASLFATYSFDELLVVFNSALSSLSASLARLQREAGIAAAKQGHLPGGSSGAGGAGVADRLAQVVAAVEMEVVRLLLGCVHTCLLAGQHEAAVARVQALLEFHAFPAVPVTALVGGGRAASGGAGAAGQTLGAALRLWGAFWQSGAARVGEEGGEGWAAWYRRQHEDVLVGPTAAEAQEAAEQLPDAQQQQGGDGGAWSGWVVLEPGPSANPTANPDGGAGAGVAPAAAVEGADAAAAAAAEPAAAEGRKKRRRRRKRRRRGSTEEEGGDASSPSSSSGPPSSSDDDEGGSSSTSASGSEGEEGELEEGEVEELAAAAPTEAELLQQLGLKLEQELEGLKREGVQPRIAARWLAEERRRDAARWAPARVGGPGPGQAGGEGEEDGAEVEPESVVDLDDLKACLFPIQALGVRERLLLGLLSLLGAPLGPTWAASSQPLLLTSAPPPQDTLSHHLLGPGAWAARHLPFAALCATGADAQLLLDRSLPSATTAAATSSAATTSAAAAATLGLAPPASGNAPLPLAPLLPGGHGGAGEGLLGFAGMVLAPAACPLPWYAAHESRRAMLSRVLRVLLGRGAPLEGHPGVSLAWLLVEATEPVTPEAAAAGGAAGGEGPAWAGARAWVHGARAREAARGLLERQRGNLAMWGALAAFESLMGEVKAARRVHDATLSGASGLTAEQRALQLPPLALQAALSELHLYASPSSASPNAKPFPCMAPAEARQRLLRALHYLLWLLDGGVQGTRPFKPYKPSEAPPTAQHVASARLAASALLPGITARSAEGQLTPGDTSLVLAAALVEVVAERCVPLIPPSGADGAAAAGGGAAVAGGGGEGAAAGRALAAAGGGLPAALAILKNVMSQTPVRVRAHSLAHELLSQGFCQLAAAACLWHWDGGQQLRAPPAGVRGVVLENLRLYPANPVLLRCLVALEQQSHASARLRQYVSSSLQARPSPQLLALAVELEASRAAAATLGGVRALFERAAAAAAGALSSAGAAAAGGGGGGGSEALGLSSELWLMYMKFELQQRRLADARRVFLRAVRACPGCKQLWLDGFAAAGTSGAAAAAAAAAAAPGASTGAAGKGGPAAAAAAAGSGLAAEGGLTPREVAELMNVMGDKGVRVHTEVVEVVMAALEEAEEQGGGG